MVAWALFLFVGLLVCSTGPARSQNADLAKLLNCLKEKDNSARMNRVKQALARCPPEKDMDRGDCILKELKVNGQELDCLIKVTKIMSP
ncbi:unnamed protein product [Ixodes persulcatus]